jgi:phosphatidylglycerol---prolipoprotein diacylglyceryl transferase
MLRTLFYIPAEIGGCQVFGFGLLLAVWAVASVVTMVVLVRRQGLNADTLGYVPILLALGAIIAWLLPAISLSGPDGTPLGLPIRGYGVMMLLAVVAGTLLAVYRGKRLGMQPDMVLSVIFWMIVPGIIGARAFYVIEYRHDYYANYYAGPGGSLGVLIGAILNVTEGGLVVYGSFFGGVLGILLFIRKYRLPLLALCDLMAPPMLLGLAIGRIGCLLNGCCFGAVCDHTWAIQFPAGTPPGFTVPCGDRLDQERSARERAAVLSRLSPAYHAQLDRGQLYGFTLSSNPDTRPCTVLGVIANMPAVNAELKAGDRLVSINGYSAATTKDAYVAIEDAFFDGRSLEIQVEGGREITIPALKPPPGKSLPVEPSQPLSTIDAFLLCLVLLGYDPYRRRDGELFAVMLSIYPITRFLIEGLRTDEAAVLGTGMSIGQCVSVLLLLCAGGLWFYLLRRPKGVASFADFSPPPSDIRSGPGDAAGAKAGKAKKHGR